MARRVPVFFLMTLVVFLLPQSFMCEETGNSTLIKTKPHIPRDFCKDLLNEFSDNVSNYTECINLYARPIAFCLRCRDDYLSVIDSFRTMEEFTQDGVTCKEILTKQDRLGIVMNAYDFVAGPTSLWTEGSCENCYEKNDPDRGIAAHVPILKGLLNDTLSCFSQYMELKPIDKRTHKSISWPIAGVNGSLCVNCSQIYNKLRAYFWSTVVPTNDKKRLSGVCFDLRDEFNMTGLIWTNDFLCEKRLVDWAIVSSAVIPMLVFVLLSYTLEPFILRLVSGEKYQHKATSVLKDVFDQDNNDDEEMKKLHSAKKKNQLVVPDDFDLYGMSAKEFVSKLKYKQQQNDVSYAYLEHADESCFDENDNIQTLLPSTECLKAMSQVKALEIIHKANVGKLKVMSFEENDSFPQFLAMEVPELDLDEEEVQEIFENEIGDAAAAAAGNVSFSTKDEE